MSKEKYGFDKLWAWFGLSYANWLTLPRVLMHEMPDDWQKKMADLLSEYDEHWDFSAVDLSTRVLITKNGKYIKTPDFLVNYRYPDRSILSNMRNKVVGQQ